MSSLLDIWGIGKLKFSASIASLIALILFLIIQKTGSFAFGINLVVFFTILVISAITLHRGDIREDKREIVIDEFLGMFVCLLVVNSALILVNFGLFAAFRVLDIIKIPPFSIIDKKMKNLYGLLLDDITIGMFVGFVYFVIINTLFR